MLKIRKKSLTLRPILQPCSYFFIDFFLIAIFFNGKTYQNV